MVEATTACVGLAQARPNKHPEPILDLFSYLAHIALGHLIQFVVKQLGSKIFFLTAVLKKFVDH